MWGNKFILNFLMQDYKDRNEPRSVDSVWMWNPRPRKYLLVVAVSLRLLFGKNTGSEKVRKRNVFTFLLRKLVPFLITTNDPAHLSLNCCDINTSFEATIFACRTNTGWRAFASDQWSMQIFVETHLIFKQLIRK